MNEINEQIKLEQQIVALEEFAKQYLSKESITRLGILKSAHPQKALQVIAFIAQIAQNGQIKDKINDEEFKNILKEFDKNIKKKEFKLRM